MWHMVLWELSKRLVAICLVRKDTLGLESLSYSARIFFRGTVRGEYGRKRPLSKVENGRCRPNLDKITEDSELVDSISNFFEIDQYSMNKIILGFPKALKNIGVSGFHRKPSHHPFLTIFYTWHNMKSGWNELTGSLLN